MDYGKSRLAQGLKAPDFNSTTLKGNKVGLSQFRGKKIWLCFYRYAKCPLCNLHLSEISKRYASIKQSNAEVIAVFESGPKDFGTFLNEPKIDLPENLIPDPEKKIYEIYGAERSILAMFKPTVAWAWTRAQLNGHIQKMHMGDLFQVPAQFLIREDGVIHTAFYGDHLADHIPWWRVERFLKEEPVEEWKKRTGAGVAT